MDDQNLREGLLRWYSAQSDILQHDQAELGRRLDLAEDVGDLAFLQGRVEERITIIRSMAEEVLRPAGVRLSDPEYHPHN
jgi:hypothetical protein